MRFWRFGIGKAEQSVIAGVFYASLGAIAFFGIWFLSDYTLDWKIQLTAVMIVCAILSALAMLCKLLGTFAKDIKASFVFGAFVIFALSLIVYFGAISLFVHAFYAFVSIVLSGVGTYFLIYSMRKG